MMDALLSQATQAYALNYYGAILVIALVECVVPRKRPGDTLRLRWFGNFALTITSTLLTRALFPVAGIAWAVVCMERGWGLFNQIGWPFVLEFVVSILVLDFFIYVQHYALHRIPLLWRVHRTHHTDQDYDFTTGVRFHPIEAVIAAGVGLGGILVVGASPAAVLVSQLLATAFSFLEHANVRVPNSLDRVVRLIVVTPDMHRIHHSQAPGESRSNFSNVFSCWDRLFGTYVDQPAAGHDAMQFGLPGFSDRKHQTIPWMLIQPFLSEPSGSAGVTERSVVGAP